MNTQRELRVALAVARKDLRIALSQRLTVALGILVPVNFLVLFMLFALTGGRAPTALVDDDHGPYAARFVAALRGAHSFAIAKMSAGDAERALHEGRTVAVITIPASFDQDLVAGRTVELPVEVNNLQTDFTNDVRRAVPLAITSFYADAYPDHLVVRTREVDVQARDTDYIPYLAVSVAALGLLLAGLLQGALLAAREFESATVKELMLSPAPRWSVCLGKVLAALAVNTVSAVVVLAVVTALVGAWPRHPGELAVFAGLMMLGSAGLGVMVGSLLRRVGAAIPLAIATSLPLFFLSGPFGPPNWLGAVNGALAYLSPAYYGIGALQHAFHGYQTGPSSLATDAAVLALIAAAGVVGSSRLLSAGGVGR